MALIPDLHDVEFVVSSPIPTPSGHHLEALNPSSASASTHHLHEPYEVLGAGDSSILACLAVLREYQAQGKIRQVGISAFPLPVLLRLARVIKQTTGKPLDIIQCYAHQTLLNSALEEGYLAAFEDAGVQTIVNAAPLSMGILTTGGGPDWHPARSPENASVFDATREAVKVCDQAGATIEKVASDYGYRELRQNGGKGKVVPVVIGCKDLSEIHRTLESYGRVKRGEGKWEEVQKKCRDLFREKGADGWTWESPGRSSFD
jgi:D-arabinose 1-dehydrogenase